MSLQPQAIYLVPAETARVARAIFPTGNLVMRMYDEFGMLFHDRDFADLFPIQGQPAEAPARLALVTLLQFMEGCTLGVPGSSGCRRCPYPLGLEIPALSGSHRCWFPPHGAE